MTPAELLREGAAIAAQTAHDQREAGIEAFSPEVYEFVARSLGAAHEAAAEHEGVLVEAVFADELTVARALVGVPA